MTRPLIDFSLKFLLGAALVLGAGCSDDDGQTQPDTSVAADAGSALDTGGALDTGAATDSAGADSAPASDSASSGDGAGAADSAATDGGAAADAASTAKHYMFWQSPGGFARRGPAIEVFGDGTIRFWKSMTQQAPHQTMSWTQEIKTSPAFVAPLFSLLEQVDFRKLPHAVKPLAECWPSFYWRKCFSCKPTTVQHNRVVGLRPEMDAVLKWLDNNLATKTEAALPSKFCFGA